MESDVGDGSLWNVFQNYERWLLDNAPQNVFNLYCLVSCKIQIQLSKMIEEYRGYKWYRYGYRKLNL